MTPGEVRGLQALAEQHGASLTINPDTGLPEAFSLRSLLPMIAGIALTPIMGPMGAAMAVGGVETARTGDIGKGLMAGLGAYGGANLGAGLGATGQAAGQSAAQAALVGSPDLAAQSTAMGNIGAGESFYGAQLGPQITPMIPTETGAQLALQPSYTSLTPEQISVGQLQGSAATSPSIYGNMYRGAENIFSSGPTGEAARSAFMSNIGGYGGLAKSGGMAAAPMIAEAMTPKPFEPIPEEEFNYEGPYTPTPRQVRYPTEEERRRMGTGEFRYFMPSNPVPFQDGGVTGPTISPSEAQIYQNIANAQMLAGLPMINTSQFNVSPPVDRSSLVYNPIVPGTGPIGGVEGEQNYGFAPRMTREEADKAVAKSLRKGDGSGIFGRLFGGDSSDQEIIGYTVNNEPIYSQQQNYTGFKRGGVPMLEDGGFVLTKKAVDGLGKGDNKRGQKVANRGLGAVPIKGPGTGTSDSIRTTIEGKQPALVSNGEAYVPKRQVEKKGGAKKFYALMKAAERRA
jgi:hypothetical protein